MRKIFLIKKLRESKTRTAVKERKPLEIYNFYTQTATLLFDVADKVIYRSSGAFGNEEITEVTNIYGVKFRKHAAMKL